MTNGNAFAAKRRNDEFLENQTAWKNLPMPGHLNFILTALLSHICLKSEDLVQQTVNCIKAINFWMTNFSPSQIWINFRKSQEISRFSNKGIAKNFRSEISLCRFDTLTRNKGLTTTYLQKPASWSSGYALYLRSERSDVQISDRWNWTPCRQRLWTMKEAVLPRRNDVKMGPVNSWHASA